MCQRPPPRKPPSHVRSSTLWAGPGPTQGAVSPRVVLGPRTADPQRRSWRTEQSYAMIHTEEHKNATQKRRMEASRGRRLPLHDGHRRPGSDSSRINAACQHTMSGDPRDPQRRLDRCHLPSHPSCSDVIHRAPTPPPPASSKRDRGSNISKAEFHLNPQPR